VVEEWWTLGVDDGVSVAKSVGLMLEVEVGCKEGSIVSDEELCDGSLNDKYKDFWVGCIEEYNVMTTYGWEVVVVEWWSLSLGDEYM